MGVFGALSRALHKRRSLPVFETLRERTAFLRPSDWLVIGILAGIMSLSAGTILAGVSLALTTKVPAHGGAYAEGVVGSPRFVNPLLAISEADDDLTKLVYSGLMKRQPDGTVTPDVAASYSISDDKKTYTFILKDDARFQDGTPVTADDVVFTVKAAENPDIKSPERANWDGVQVTAIDAKTVEFTLDSPYAPFLDNLTLGILPKHLWGNVTPEEFPFTTLNERPVGSGPYAVDGITENSSGIPTEYRLKAFTRGVRTPYISRFVMKFYANEDDLKVALSANEIDGASSISATNAKREVVEAVFGRIFGVFFNQNQNKVFAEQSVREALDAAVDKQKIIDTVLGGYGSVIDGPLPPESTAETTPAEAADHIGDAIAILAKAGWKPGADGIMAKTVTVKGKKQTERLSFSLVTSNAPELKQAAQMVAADWQAIGAEVDVKFFEQSDLSLEVLRPRKYDALLFGEVVGRDPDLFAFWHSSQRNDPGLNIALYANTDTDKKLSDARTETDPDVRREKTKAAANAITKETAAVFLYAPHFVYLSPSSVSGIVLGTISSPADRFDAVDQWYLETEQVWPIFSINWNSLFKFN